MSRNFFNNPRIYIYTNFVEHNRHFLSTYYLVDPFIFPYWFYDIRQELVDVSSITVYFLSTFCPTLGHHQRRIYYKNDETFVCPLLLCKKKSVCAVTVCSVYFLNCFWNNKKVCRQKMSLRSMKFVLMKKCCQNIHTYIHICNCKDNDKDLLEINNDQFSSGYHRGGEI